MIKPARPRGRVTAEEWVRRACTLVVAGVAAYASYQHQRGYAREGGSDPTGAALWPLSVDGLLVLATVGVLKAERLSRRGRIAVWLSFSLGIAVSLAANIAAAPELTWQPVLVAGWPPVALLLAVELLAHGPRSREHRETEPVTPETEQAGTETRTATPMGFETARLHSAHAIEPSRWEQLGGDVPPHCRGAVAELSRNCAGAWHEFADQLDRSRTSRVRGADTVVGGLPGEAR
jgi:hypothetical protein